MKLTDRIHLIGSGRFGFALSDDHDGNVYLVDGGAEVALVDSGSGIGTAALAGLVAAAGFAPERVSAILLTHRHADHSGGAGDFQREFGTRVLASGPTASAVRDADAMNASLDRARRARAYPPDYRFAGVDAVEVCADGDVVQVGEVAITAIDTSGHCAGHFAYLLADGGRTAAFTGDALLPGGEIVIQPAADLSLPQSVEALERLAALRFDALMPGHGAPALRDGHRHATLGILEAERSGVPSAFRTPPFHEAS